MHEKGEGGIGVATADNPAGPFKDALGHPLIDEVVNGAQPIDQFVFRDDDGTYYMYYGGWQHCNMVRLGEDLTSIVPFEDGEIYKEITPQGYVEGLLKTIGLENTDRKKPAGSYSLGMRQRLGIGLALVGDPKIIILDEPINGLDPQGIVEVREMLVRLRDEKGITIMISSHILDELAKVADAYGIIHEGTLLDELTAEELKGRST